MINPYWVTFADGKSGTVEASNVNEAVERAEALDGHHVKLARILPYPADPVLFRDPNGPGCPPFCYAPAACAGHTSCPKRRACSE